MIAEGGYFDGSRDAILVAGSLIHNSLDSICDNTEIEQGNFHSPSFFIDDICNPTNLTSEPARTINHIQHRAEFDMDQDLHGHMIQETQVETSNWVPLTLSPSSECGPFFIASLARSHGATAARVSARSARSAALRGWEKLGPRIGVVEHGFGQDLTSEEEEGARTEPATVEFFS